MKQVLHIFRKDVRHFWKEIGLWLAVLVAFTWNAPRSWQPEPNYGDFVARFIYPVLLVLLLVVWWFLIARIVQDESLVGDRQFWITRPVEWKKLLIAKLILLFLFIHVPLFISQCVTLWRAGFSPLMSVSGLVWMQLMLLATLVLAAFALAAVTSTIAQVILACVAVVLYMVGLDALDSVVPNNSTLVGNSDNWQFLVFVVACIAVVIIQYASRRSTVSRFSLTAAALLIALIDVGTPYGKLIAKAYPAETGSELPVKFAFDASQSKAKGLGSDDGKNVQIELPLLISDISAGSAIRIEGRRVFAQSAQGRWDSGWRGGANLLLPSERNYLINFSMPKRIYEKMHSAPATVSVQFAISVLRFGKPWEVALEQGDFNVPRVGICSLVSPGLSSIRCRSPLRKPNTLLVTSSSTTSTCEIPEEQRPPKDSIAYDLLWRDDSSPADSGIDPVSDFTLFLTYRDSMPEPVSRFGPRLCPGTPITLSESSVSGRMRSSLSIPQFSLDKYRLPTSMTLTIGVPR
ncbi:MAG TPA: hypothetical protein VFQ00_09245 [Terriglobales bacterium]|nr:hypothetical protein [Terriglobales bacterium]